MKNKLPINFFILIFIISFSGYFITKLPLSPVYVFFLLGSSLLIMLFIKDSRVKVTSEILVAFVLLFYFSVFQQLLFNPNISAYVNFTFSILVLIISLISLNKTSSNTIINVSEKMIYFSLPLLIYEAYYRISNPVFFVDFAAKGREDLFFYYYKMNSIMYQDSNFVALFILSLFFFLLYLKNLTSKSYYFSFFLLTFLLVATISRAAILTLVLFYFLYLIRKVLYRYRRTMSFFLILSVLFIFPVLLEHRTIDDSFSSKFGIFDKMIEYVQNANLNNLLFGVGFGNAVDVMGIGAHNFFVTYLVESGLVGLFLIVILWGYFLYKTRLSVGIVMFPFLFVGLSLSTGAIPYLYAMFAVILVLESRRRQIAQ